MSKISDNLSMLTTSISIGCLKNNSFFSRAKTLKHTEHLPVSPSPIARSGLDLGTLERLPSKWKCNNSQSKSLSSPSCLPQISSFFLPVHHWSLCQHHTTPGTRTRDYFTRDQNQGPKPGTISPGTKIQNRTLQIGPVPVHQVKTSPRLIRFDDLEFLIL